MLQVIAERVSDRIKGEYNITIPWDQLLELFLQFIEQCFPQQSSFLSAAKSPTMVQRLSANVVIRRTLGVGGRRNVLAIQSAMFSVAAEATDAELGQCHAEGCEALGMSYNSDPSN